MAGNRHSPFRPLAVQRVPYPGGRIGCRGIEHEEPDDPGGMTFHSDRDGGLVTRDARDQRGTLHATGIHFLNPAIRQRFGRAWIVPVQFAVQSIQTALPACALPAPAARHLARQCLKESGRKEMAVSVVDHAIRR